MPTMADSDSSLSSAPPTDDEMEVVIPEAVTKKAAGQKKKKKKNGTILTFFKQRSPSPPPRKRAASPPHEPVPEDNADIAFVVMFRSRFNEAFPRGSPHVGPQDIELGVAEDTPSADVEGLLCALLGLVLNRKKPVEKGHYGRALEEAIQTQKAQWPTKWTGNPLSGGRSFNTMTAEERITLLHSLCLWSLNQNEQIKAIINNAYKSRSTKDKLDTNIPLSVQAWGRDGDKRRYYLVEGQNDTHFRIYRESDPKLKKVQWISVAGSIDELRGLAKKLEEEDGHKEARALGERMLNAIPRFEASENVGSSISARQAYSVYANVRCSQKRKRREYTRQRKDAFTRPEPGFAPYEMRTRGKRQRYTYDEEDDFDSDNLSVRRSGRQSARDTPAAPSGPTVTASGRQVRSRATGLYGETLHSGQVTDHGSSINGDYDDTVMTNGVDHEPAVSKEAPTEPLRMPALVPDGRPTSSEQPPIVPVVHTTHNAPADNTAVFPKLSGFVSAPTPPYSTLDEAPKPQQQHTQPAPMPTASWQ
ncbi:Extracellular matrix 3 [Pyrenophora seminiperda CCB06]|uniref:Extracellular matrix 3 n=1 Tax=Pyrenophora seminiperda CCB06 TaxID=1302712 RepID=A0A3M7M914_9PLEO|nr:Extracellular matrix 3 [Pyrenophora seminiperda CCB06]